MNIQDLVLLICGIICALTIIYDVVIGLRQHRLKYRMKLTINNLKFTLTLLVIPVGAILFSIGVGDILEKIHVESVGVSIIISIEVFVIAWFFINAILNEAKKPLIKYNEEEQQWENERRAKSFNLKKWLKKSNDITTR